MTASDRALTPLPPPRFYRGPTTDLADAEYTFHRIRPNEWRIAPGPSLKTRMSDHARGFFTKYGIPTTPEQTSVLEDAHRASPPDVPVYLGEEKDPILH